MYFEDVPIKKQEEDLLHRRGFAKRLGKSLVEADIKDGYCVGLFGSWGSGKSSIVNMVMEEIELITTGQEDKPIVMYFNPWNFSSSEQLLQQYFIMLADKFMSGADKQLYKIGHEIQKYASMFDLLGDAGKVLGAGGKFLGRLLEKKTFGGTKDISKQRNLIIEALAKQTCKIIIVIDDIDRLSNDEIKLIFQLVNSVAKFPNTIYLLAFDREIVARALSEVQNYDGEKYLEKIIQVPVEVPEITSNCLWEAFFDKLNHIMARHPQMILEAEYWVTIFYGCIGKYIDNLRDVIRISNALNIKCDMVGSEVNFTDLIAITVIENKLPDLYRWIKNNKEKVIGSQELSLKNFGKSETEISTSYINEIKQLNEHMADEYISILKLLFPFFSAKVSENSFYRNDNLRRKLRMGHEDIFDRYFVLDLNDEDVSRIEADYAIKNMSYEELVRYIHTINEKKKIINFLKEIQAAIEEIDENRKEILIKALLNTVNEFKGETTNGWFELSAFDIALYRMRDILEAIEREEDRYNLVLEIIRDLNENSIQPFTLLFNRIELAFGRLSADGVENGGKKVLSIEQLEMCEEMLLQQIKKLSQEKCLMDLDGSRMILHLYEGLDNKGYMHYMKHVLENPIYKLKYICFSMEKWTGGSSISWEQNDAYKNFLNDKEVDDAYKQCIEDNSIGKLNVDQLHRVIAFQLCKDGHSSGRRSVSDDDVVKEIEELKRKKIIE